MSQLCSLLNVENELYSHDFMSSIVMTEVK